MQKSYWRAGLAALFALMLAGCQSPETPQEISKVFWQAMAEGDAGKVVKWSTLSDASGYERFPEQWYGAEPSFGRVVINGDQASVVTLLRHQSEAESPLEAPTHLVQRDGDWLVDYPKTRKGFTHRSPFNALIDEVNQLGETLSREFDRADWSEKMDALAQQLDELSSQAARKAERAIDEYGEVLREQMQSLRQSIERALENNKGAPADDRRALRTTSMELDQRIKDLKEPTLDALAKASHTLVEAKERLKAVSEAEYGEFKQQWNATLEQIDTRTGVFFKELRQALE